MRSDSFAPSSRLARLVVVLAGVSALSALAAPPPPPAEGEKKAEEKAAEPKKEKPSAEAKKGAEPKKGAEGKDDDGRADEKVTESVDDQARFLAGLPVPEGSPLAPYTKTAWWKSYAKGLDADWAKLREERLDKMGAWASKVVAPKIDGSAPVFYFFGGPDFLTMPVVYPNAPAWYLCGLEPLGKVPNLGSMGGEALAEAMRNLRLSLNSIIRLSFFKTNDMVGDLTRTELRGVVPLLYVFAARSNAKVLAVTRVEITDDGELKELGDKEKCVGVPGMHLRVQLEGHAAPQDLYYFKHNIADDVLKAGPGFLGYFKKVAPANTFLKAASFLLHRPKQFGTMHDFLFANSKSILQDDSGLPFASFAAKGWDVTLFGTYLRPRPPFTMRLQEDMQAAYKTGPVEPLDFVTGYRKTGESNLVLALPKGGGKPAAVEPAPEKAPEKAPAPAKP